MNPRWKTKPITCDCPSCAGRLWPLDEIRVAAAASGRRAATVNKLTLPGIAKAVGHPLAYVETRVVGAWRKRTAADAPARDAGRLRRTPAHRSRLAAVNGMRIGAADGPVTTGAGALEGR